MNRRIILMTVWLGLLSGLAAAQTEAEREAQALAVIKHGITSAVGYADADIDLAQRASQFWVQIVNSPLNARPGAEREADATRIVAATAQAIAGKAAYSCILGVHIDYVRRSPTGGATKVIDGIDFRRTQSGSFVHHIS